MSKQFEIVFEKSGAVVARRWRNGCVAQENMILEKH